MTSTLAQKLDYFLSSYSLIHISTPIPMYEETDWADLPKFQAKGYKFHLYLHGH